MSAFGGGSAESLKTAIDSVFQPSGQLPCEEYTFKLLGCTSDGASVNTGEEGGLLTLLERDGPREWLTRIHCVNHRIELAVKDSLLQTSFNDVEKLYMGIFNLLKNSGAIKSDVKQSAEALDISGFTVTKITGTIFVSHRRRAFERFLNMWPALIQAFQNTLATRKHKGETKAKIAGFIKNLRSYEILCMTAAYLDILDKISPASLVFEGNGLLAYEVDATVKYTKLELENLAENTGTPDEFLDSHLARFPLTTDEEGETRLTVSFTKYGHNLRKPCNREYRNITFERYDKIVQCFSRKGIKIKERNQLF